MNARDARVLFEQYQRLLRQDRSACAGHTYGDNLFLRVSHVFRAGRFSLAAAFLQVKLRQSSSAMIEFAAVGGYESTLISENFGIPEVRRTLPRPNPPETSAFGL